MICKEDIPLWCWVTNSFKFPSKSILGSWENIWNVCSLEAEFSLVAKVLLGNLNKIVFNLVHREYYSYILDFLIPSV